MLTLSKQERLRERYKALKPGYRPALEVYTALLDSLVTPATRLLDVGCGPGGLVRHHEGQARLVAGVDRYAARFQEPAEIRNLVEADNAALPIEAGTIDVATCSWVLEHLDDPAAVFAEIHRVLVPGGHLIFITPNALNYAVWLRRLVPNRVSKRVVRAIYARDEDFINPTFYRANTTNALRRLLPDAGFGIDRLDTIGDPSYLALNELLFRVSIGVEGLIDRFWPASRVHLVGHARKPA